MMIPDIIWKPVAAEIDEKSLIFSSIIKKTPSALERNKMSHLLQVIWILSFRWEREGIARSDWLLVKAKQSSAPHARSPCERAEEEEGEEAQQQQKKKKTEQVPVSAGSEQFTFALPDSMKHSPLTERKLLI